MSAIDQIKELYEELDNLREEVEQWRRSPIQNSMAVMADFERYVIELQKRTKYDCVAYSKHKYTLETIKRYEYRVMGGECCKEVDIGCVECEADK